MTNADTSARRFTLDEANTLLPEIRRRTDAAVGDVDTIVRQLEALAPGDPSAAALDESLQAIVSEWADDVTTLGAEVKGLWLVDFDNGEGYYCWRHPEPAVTHYHGYEEGFAGRVKVI